MCRHILPLAASMMLFASCTHFSESPLRDGHGTPVVIRIPGIKENRLPKPIDVMTLDMKLLAGTSQEELVSRHLPGMKGSGHAIAKLDGMTGEVKTAKGEVFHAYFPILKVEAQTSQAKVDQAANNIAAELYQRAKKKCQVYPMTDLAIRN